MSGLSLVLMAAAALTAPVSFSPAKITAVYTDGATREFVASAMEAASFEQFATAPGGGDFGFAVDCRTAFNAYPYPCRLIVVGPTTELRISTEQSIASWRFVGPRQVQVCSAPLHGGPDHPPCKAYALPE